MMVSFGVLKENLSGTAVKTAGINVPKCVQYYNNLDCHHTQIFSLFKMFTLWFSLYI